MIDTLGDRMKRYEMGTSVRLIDGVPIMARVDGRAFHTFTRGMERPFDKRLVDAMVHTAKELAVETNASMVYTQSDEITLTWFTTDPKSQIWFAGKHSKMVSQLGALATLHFYRKCLELLPEYAERLPTFDARVWDVPNTTVASEVFLWREWDATRNSISMAAQSVFSHKELQGKTAKEMQEMMLLQRDINWNDYPSFFKRGTYIQRQKREGKFSAEELENLPEKHEARSNPDLVFERSFWGVKALPPMSKIANREAVIFEGAEPITRATRECESVGK
jgi:tRNA(His) guanylyltransferase